MPSSSEGEPLQTGAKRRFPLRGGHLLSLAVVIFFAAAPFLLPSYKSVDLAVKIIIFATLVASFDIMLGYTGILSFGHGMFFGIGAYCVAFLIGKYGEPTYLNLVLGLCTGLGVAAALALFVSFLSLRVKAIFFAMVTLAIADLSEILAMKLSAFSGGEDGISLFLPGVFAMSFNPGTFMGLEITGRVLTYYLIFLSCLGLFLLMLRFTHSPLGRVLQAIRDNEQRAEAIGYRTFLFQATAITMACMVATVTGGLYALWVGYVNPESCLGVFTIMLGVLLMCIIGGMGTLYGGIVGAAFYMGTETFLPDLESLAQSSFPNFHLLHGILERWPLVLGLLFILVVIFFPRGVVGSVRHHLSRR